MSAKHDVNIRAIVTVAVAGVLALVVIIIGIQAWFAGNVQGELDEKSADAVFADLANLRLEQQQRISRYEWVDRDRNLVAIPIDEAMRIMVQTKGRFPTTQPSNP